MATAETKTSAVSSELEELGLEHYVLQLELNGLTVVPPEVHGVSIDTFKTMTNLLLTKCEELVGCKFSLNRGPHKPVSFGNSQGSVLSDESGQQSQFLIQRLTSYDRSFRDLALNPVALALMRHLIGPKAMRFSSHNSFIKWQGEFGYGSKLGMHADQMAVPLPWGRRALTANTNWCLTDYTLDGGALAYVPGSHREGARPSFPRAVQQAVPVEAPLGSMIVFHGATWHGAFPRKNPGMRISIANYYRHLMVTSQEDLQGGFDRTLAEDSCNPKLFGYLAGFHDEFPYQQPNQPIPHVDTA